MNECIICIELNMYILYLVGGEYVDVGIRRGRGGIGNEGGMKRERVFIIDRVRSYSIIVKIIWSVNR